MLIQHIPLPIPLWEPSLTDLGQLHFSEDEKATVGWQRERIKRVKPGNGNANKDILHIPPF